MAEIRPIPQKAPEIPQGTERQDIGGSGPLTHPADQAPRAAAGSGFNRHLRLADYTV
jgi:hypothetical protein